MSYRIQLAKEPLVTALWWFIENSTDDLTDRTNMFFDLRRRVREHHETNELYKELKPADHLNEMIEVVEAAAHDELLKAVKSLVNDIESMQCVNKDYFGAFSEYDIDDNGRGPVDIEWPNLAISLAAVKKLIEPQTIEGKFSNHHRKALGHDGTY